MASELWFVENNLTYYMNRTEYPWGLSQKNRYYCQVFKIWRLMPQKKTALSTVFWNRTSRGFNRFINSNKFWFQDSEKLTSSLPIPLPNWVRKWGPFLRSDTETDFPRPVRSAKRSRFAATVFVRSKPVNWVRILPQMFMFLTDTTKTDVLHILVRTHL